MEIIQVISIDKEMEFQFEIEDNYSETKMNLKSNVYSISITIGDIEDKMQRNYLMPDGCGSFKICQVYYTCNTVPVYIITG